MSQVTKKMFMEVYARQLVNFSNGFFKDMDRLGRALKYADRALNDQPLTVHSVQRYKEWVQMSTAVQSTCEALGIKRPTLAKLRALPKE